MLKVGDKIKIIYMEDEPQYDGITGYVTSINKDPWGDTQIHGTWGRMLYLWRKRWIWNLKRRRLMEIKVKLGETSFDMVSSLLGQMSDGYWEENKSYRKYYENIKLDFKTKEMTVDISGIRYHSNSNSPEMKKYFGYSFSEKEYKKNILKFLAKKARIVLNAELKSKNLKKFEEYSNKECEYLSGYQKRRTFAQILSVIEEFEDDYYLVDVYGGYMQLELLEQDIECYAKTQKQAEKEAIKDFKENHEKEYLKSLDISNYPLKAIARKN